MLRTRGRGKNPDSNDANNLVCMQDEEIVDLQSKSTEASERVLGLEKEVHDIVSAPSNPEAEKLIAELEKEVLLGVKAYVQARKEKKLGRSFHSPSCDEKKYCRQRECKQNSTSSRQGRF